MTENFNTYIEKIDFKTWRELCIREGSLMQFAKDEEFVSVGKVGRYIGFIQSGALKYVARSHNGTEHVMGLVFGEGLVADWPFCLYGKFEPTAKKYLTPEMRFQHMLRVVRFIDCNFAK